MYLDINGADEWCFAVEVPGIDDIIFSGIKDKLCQVYFTSIDGIQQCWSAGCQTLAMITVPHFWRVRHAGKWRCKTQENKNKNYFYVTYINKSCSPFIWDQTVLRGSILTWFRGSVINLLTSWYAIDALLICFLSPVGMYFVICNFDLCSLCVFFYFCTFNCFVLFGAFICQINYILLYYVLLKVFIDYGFIILDVCLLYCK